MLHELEVKSFLALNASERILKKLKGRKEDLKEKILSV